MRMYDILDKKRRGAELTAEEIEYTVKGYTEGTIPDYQMSALLMAIAINGMSDKETYALTKSMVETGETADLSKIHGIKVDKHSTGGVGDKTSPVIGAIVAACDVPVAKMSGRALGHTGGTIDKLESIPGYSIEISNEHFFEIVNTVGVSIIGQTGNLAPADKKIYQLRDVTATIESIPLIASSIMSKKIAGSADRILLDVKVGSGAFMKDIGSATALAEKMVLIGKSFGKKTIALITQMDNPLGYNIGTSLEVIEMIQVLKDFKPAVLTELCLALASNMLYLADKGTMEQCEDMARNSLASGRALKKFKEMIEAHGGDVRVVDDISLFPKAKYIEPVYAGREGYIQQFNSERCGIASAVLGSGRDTKDSEIDYSAGIKLCVKVGDYVKKGDVMAFMHTSRQETLIQANELLKSGINIADQMPVEVPLIYKRITSEDL
jgi:pyrimidine-nucleoside phosphorylase